MGALMPAEGRRIGSDRRYEFVECCDDSEVLVSCSGAELVAAASQVLNERVTSDHD